MSEHIHEFRAETRKVLNILTHSLYTNQEIFLRELISNASDALDKLRFLQSRGDTVRDTDLPLEISIKTDKVQRLLIIQDHGIGMTREEMVEDLGTIAHSGSEEFLAELAKSEKESGSDIIGRFGIGFYSVFMVADKVEVLSKAAQGEQPASLWVSDGAGEFTINDAPDQSIPRGTTVRVFLKEDAQEFLEKYRLTEVIRKHSNFVSFPILLDGERINTTPALWREPKSSLKKEQYDDFYKYLTYDSKAPLDTLHISIDAPVQFHALMFIPDITKDYFGLYRDQWGLDLYVRRVLIQHDNKNLIPQYMGFVRGIVDTEDMPLNISRETLQENVVLRKISQTLVKQTLSHLENMAKDEPEKYKKFWQLHGKLFKLGYNDFANKDRIIPLMRFNSSAMNDGEDLTSFDEYISRAKDGQKEIWYMAAPGREAARINPYMEVFRRKGIEVLYLFEPVDEFLMESLGQYKDFTFKAVEHAETAILDKFKEEETPPKETPLSNEDQNVFDTLLASIKKVLGEQVKDVKVSHRLTNSPACLVSPDDSMTSSMDKVLRVMQKDDSIPQKILEVNRDHPILRTMLRIQKKDPDSPQLSSMIQSLFDAALLLDGFVKDPYILATRINTLLENASAWYTDLKKF